MHKVSHRSVLDVSFEICIVRIVLDKTAQPHLHGRAVPFLIPYLRTSESYSYATRIC